jgi:hypothetical protein
MDIRLELCDGQTLVGNGTTSQSTDIIDFASSDLNIGAGTPVYLNIKIGTVVAGGTSIDFRVYSDSDTTVTDGTLLYSTGAIVVATLVAGYEVLRMPIDVRSDPERYFGLSIVRVGNITGGTVDAWLELGTKTDEAVQVMTSNI